MYSSTNPKLQLAWDNTSLNAFRECPRKYQYSILLGYSFKLLPSPLKFGLVYHSSLEKYDKALALGDSRDVAIRKALRHALEATWEDGKPWTPFEPKEKARSRFTLCRTIVWYTEAYKEDPIETYIMPDGEAAVELSFRISLPFSASSGEGFLYCGHLDKIGRFQGELKVVERKHTAMPLDERYFARYTPDGQVSGYTVGGNTIALEPITGTIIDAAQIGVTFSRFRRDEAHRSKSMNEEWLRDTQSLIKMAESCAEQDYWPKNESSCHHFAGCVYRSICSKGCEVREQFLEAGFSKRLWNPLDSRE